MLPCETLSKRAVPLMSRRVLHIPIGFAPLPIIHNFEGVSSRSALHMCSMPSAQDSIALYQSQHEQDSVSSPAGIADKELHLDAHALAGLYSCKIRSFDGYIQSINPNLTYAIRSACALWPCQPLHK